MSQNDSKMFINSKAIQLFVVLIQPDIPQNTGNIARLCCVTGSKLVLVRPLGFRLNDALLKRAGMDYWERLNPIILDDLDEFYKWSNGRRIVGFTARGNTSLYDFKFQFGDVLCFGSESEGFPIEFREFLSKNGTAVRIPMIKNERCLNVSSSAAICVYEAIRQISNW